jgi:hypothetical protein
LAEEGAAELTLQEQVEELEVFERFLNKQCPQVSMLYRWVRVGLEEFGLLLLLRKETRRCGTILLILPLVLRHFWPMVGVKGVAVGVHRREVTEVAAVEVVDTQRRLLLSLVSGVLVTALPVVWGGHMILLRDTMAATVGWLVLIMVQVAEVAVQPR